MMARVNSFCQTLDSNGISLWSFMYATTHVVHTAQRTTLTDPAHNVATLPAITEQRLGKATAMSKRRRAVTDSVIDARNCAEIAKASSLRASYHKWRLQGPGSGSDRAAPDTRLAGSALVRVQHVPTMPCWQAVAATLPQGVRGDWPRRHHAEPSAVAPLPR